MARLVAVTGAGPAARRPDEAALTHAEDVFELLMGSSVEPRRDFIIAGADAVDRERIDA